MFFCESLSYTMCYSSLSLGGKRTFTRLFSLALVSSPGQPLSDRIFRVGISYLDCEVNVLDVCFQ